MAPTSDNFCKLQRNHRSMIRWICNVYIEDQINSASLLEKLGIKELSSALRYNRLRWFGHVCRDIGAIKRAWELEVAGSRCRGRPRKTWDDSIKMDMECGGLQMQILLTEQRGGES